MSGATVDVLDWGGGNTGSVLRALERAGAVGCLVADADAVRHSERLIFPGVGAFGAVMDALRARGLADALAERLSAASRPFLGICVGLQALFESSEESPGARGLGAFPGAIVKLRARKVPQIGWNEVAPSAAGAPLIERGHAYFVNSYAPPAGRAESKEEWIAAESEHEGCRFASAVRRGPVWAVQFHPEKSGRYGAGLLARWLGRAC